MLKRTALPRLVLIALALSFPAGVLGQSVPTVVVDGGTPAEPAPAATAPAAPPAPTLAPCTGENLIAGSLATGDDVKGGPFVTKDGRLAQEGTWWDTAGQSTAYKTPKSSLNYDLRAVHSLRAFVLQGDNNDEYIVEASTDGTKYEPVWVAPPYEGGDGLRTRIAVLPNPATGRYLKITGRGGDNFYSVSEFQVHCDVPAVWPPKLSLPPKITGWKGVDNPIMVGIKAWLAGIGSIVLLLGFAFPFRGRLRDHPFAVDFVVGTSGLFVLLGWWALRDAYWPFTTFVPTFATKDVIDYTGAIVSTLLIIAWLVLRWSRGPNSFKFTRDSMIITLGLLSFASFWNLGHFHFDHYIHIWEHYHYYVGAKYAPELRYGLLYECTGVADLEDGLKERVEKRKIRRLGSDNELGDSAEVIAHPERCKNQFSAERWDAFKVDNRFFRSQFSSDRWDKSQNDHGYNGTPVWGIAGRLLADFNTPLTKDKIFNIGVIDSALLIAMWLAVLWAFGWRATCIALIYWGTNFPARFYWTGGAYLRYDWLFWLVIGIVALKKDKHALGGAILTYATLLRIFPGFVVAAVIAKALYRMIQERRFVLSPELWRFAIGCVVALALLIPASGWATGGLDAWPQFVTNSKKHLETPLTNNMGLKTLVGYDYATRAAATRNDNFADPFKNWKEARRHFYHARAPLFLALVLGCFWLLGRAGMRLKVWEQAALGTGFILIASELTCYYYCFLLTYGLLWERSKLPGIAAAILSCLTCIFSGIWGWNDDHFAAMSLGYVVVVGLSVWWLAYGKEDDGDPIGATVGAPTLATPPKEKKGKSPSIRPAAV